MKECLSQTKRSQQQQQQHFFALPSASLLPLLARHSIADWDQLIDLCGSVRAEVNVEKCPNSQPPLSL